MKLQAYAVTIMTDASGAATVYAGLDSGQKITGRVHAIKYAPGTLESATLTITGETTAVAIMTKASAGTSTVWYYPRAAANKVADGAAHSDYTEDVYVYHERIKCVVASGGNTLTGTITYYIDES